MLGRARQKLSGYVSTLYFTELAAEDALALQQLAPLAGGPLPWTKFSMRPAAIEAAVSDVIINRRRAIMECGSGNSTVYLARLLARLGEGHIVTIEHDPTWADLTAELLRREGLMDWATVARASLVDGWYDHAAIPAMEPIDLLVVDGPPAPTAALAQARYPAVPFFSSSLAAGATVLIDDADRPGEQVVIERWSREHRLFFSSGRGGFAVARR